MTNVTIRMQLLGYQGGQNCYTNFQYQIIDATELDLTAIDVRTAWVASVLPEIVAFTAEDFQFVSLLTRINYTGGLYDSEDEFPLTMTGGVVADALPVYNTVSFTKVADPVDQLGTDPVLIKRGRLSFSGVPETYQNNRIPAAGIVSQYNEAAAIIRAFDVGDDTAEMRIFRFAPGSSTGAIKNARVAALVFNEFGTQLTRK